MLKKRHRLSATLFESFFKTGRRYHGSYLQLVHSPHENFHGAIVVGKKIYPRAVDRNLYRRRLYAALYALSKQQRLQGVYIFLLKPTGKGVPYRVLADELKELVGRIR